MRLDRSPRRASKVLTPRTGTVTVTPAHVGNGIVNRPSVAVVLTSYNGKDDTLECLRSLAALTYPNYSVIVMDDASGDRTADTVARDFPSVRVVHNPKNLGYIRNLNRGVMLSMDADYILILNNDLTVAPDLIDRLVDVAERDPRIALCGPEMYRYHEPDTLWAAGGDVSPWTGRSYHHETNGLAGPADVGYIPGAAMLVRRDAFEQIGFFEAAYHAYFEEVDFAFRLRRRGHRVVCVPDARIWHKVSATMTRVLSPEQRKFYGVRNRRWVLRSHASPWKRPLLHAIDAVASAFHFAYTMARSPGEAGAVFRGYCAGWRPVTPS